MKYRKAKPFSRAGLDANSTITRAQATRLIADEVAESDENPALTRNLVSHRLGRAIERGTLTEQASGSFRFGDLVAWAADTWPGKFSDWPTSRTVSPGTGRVVADTYRVTLGMSASVSGPDAAQVQRENEKLRAELEKARAECDRLRSENETLRPFKDEDQRRRRDGSDYGKRARGIPKNRDK